MRARIQRLRLPEEGRILCVSDVHGSLPYLKGLLEKAEFSEADTLILVGDLLEKGPYSLACLRYVMELAEAGNVHMVCGNCDWWYPLMFVLGTPERNLRYMNEKPFCLARQMCAELGIDVTPDMDYIAVRDILSRAFPAEFEFLRRLPEVIETEHYTFVHGGLPEGAPEEWDAWKCMKYDRFLDTPRRFDKWVICGHWPVMLYRENVVCANPVIDREKRIVSIDGGCVLKDDGQLNALVIPRNGSGDFSWIAYDSFPTAVVRTDQTGGGKSWYIRWGDAKVQVLERGAEFCRCRHIRTGYEMDILTKYVYGGGDTAEVNDCTDYVLPLKAGDRVSVVERTSRGYFVKHDGVSGWYFGELDTKP